MCPGCEWEVKRSDTVNVKFKLGKDVIKQRICKDCNKDFRPPSYYRNSQIIPGLGDFGGGAGNKGFEDDEIYKSV